MSRTRKLTDKQEEFCFLYVYTYIGDGATCYSKVYNNDNPYEVSRKAKGLLKKEYILDKITELEKVKCETKLVDKHYVIKKLVDIVEDKKEPTKEKLKALELIGKHLKMWSDKGSEGDVGKHKDMAVQAYENRMRKEKEEKEQTLGKETDNFLKFKEKDGTTNEQS